MIGTLVTEKNMQEFLPALGKDSIDDDDLIIGVVDEETDTACGVLWARQDWDNGLNIVNIFVEKSFRNRGAGKELISFLIDISKEISIENISCSYIDNEDNSYLYQLLDNAGFADISDELELYVAKAGDFLVTKGKNSADGIKVRSIKGITSELQSKLGRQDIAGSIEELSFIAFDDKEILGLILFDELGKYIELKSLEAFGGDKDKVLYNLYLSATKAFEKVLTPDTYIILHADADNAKDTFDYLTGGKAVRFVDFNLLSLEL